MHTTAVTQVILIVHVLSAIMVFGIGFAQPMIARSNPDSGQALAKYGTYIQAPALAVLVLTGVANVSIAKSDSGINYFQQAWVSISFTTWLVACVAVFLAVKAYKNGKNAAPFVGIMHLALVVALFAMVVQPGIGR